MVTLDGQDTHYFLIQQQEALTNRQHELDNLMNTSEDHARRLFDVCLTPDELKRQVRAMALPQEAKAGVVRPDQTGAEVVDKIDLVLGATDLGNRADALVANLLIDVPAFGGLREKVRAFALTAIAENRKPEEVGGVAKVIEVNRSAVEAEFSPEQCEKIVNSFRNLLAQLKAQKKAIDNLNTVKLSLKDRDSLGQMRKLIDSKVARFTDLARELMGQGSTQIEMESGEAIDEQTILYMASSIGRTTHIAEEVTKLMQSLKTDLTETIIRIENVNIKQQLREISSLS